MIALLYCVVLYCAVLYLSHPCATPITHNGIRRLDPAQVPDLKKGIAEFYDESSGYVFVSAHVSVLASAEPTSAYAAEGPQE